MYSAEDVNTLLNANFEVMDGTSCVSLRHELSRTIRTGGMLYRSTSELPYLYTSVV